MSDAKYKPLGHKSYGSIGHLPGSRMDVQHARYGTGKVVGKDFGISAGQAKICTEKPRDRHDTIIVQEKLDGSNVAVANINGQLVALTRAGLLAQSSRYEQHQLFAHWLRENEALFGNLPDGCRLCGEWLALAHGTRYDLRNRDPFVAFDLMRGSERACYAEFSSAAGRMVRKMEWLSMGPPVSIDAAMKMIDSSEYGAVDPVEGAVWRVERKGKIDFMAKYVRPDKVDGCYLPEVSGKPPIWNWHPDPQRCWWYKDSEHNGSKR